MSVAPANAPFLLRRLRELRLVDGIQEQGLAREGIVFKQTPYDVKARR